MTDNGASARFFRANPGRYQVSTPYRPQPYPDLTEAAPQTSLGNMLDWSPLRQTLQAEVIRPDNPAHVPEGFIDPRLLTISTVDSSYGTQQPNTGTLPASAEPVHTLADAEYQSPEDQYRGPDDSRSCDTAPGRTEREMSAKSNKKRTNVSTSEGSGTNCRPKRAKKELSEADEKCLEAHLEREGGNLRKKTIKQLVKMMKIAEEVVTSWYEAKLEHSGRRGNHDTLEQSTGGSGTSLTSSTEPAASSSVDRPQWPTDDLWARIHEYVRERLASPECHARERRGRNSKRQGKYACTRGRCLFKTNKKWEWKRHEAVNSPQEIYVCKACNNYITHVKCKLWDHSTKVHGERANEEDCKVKSFRCDFKRGCGFCGRRFRDWDHRLECIALHYEGKRKGKGKGASRHGPKKKSDWDVRREEHPINEFCDGDNDQPGPRPDAPVHPSHQRHPPSSDGPGGDQGSHLQRHRMPTNRFGGGAEPGSSQSSSSSGSGPYRTRAGCAAGQGSQCLSLSLRPRSTEYINKGPIGKGAYGIVERVLDTRTKVLYARKCISPPRQQEHAKMRMRDEVEILKKLNHRHIVHLKTAYAEDTSIYLVMSPVAEYNLKQYLDAPYVWPQNRPRVPKWFGCLASGLSYIHGRRIWHADIKPANILVSSSRVFYADFGSSRDVSDDSSTIASISPMTPMYAAPEVASHERHGRQADIWSLGLVFLELASFLLGFSVAQFQSEVLRVEDRPEKTSSFDVKHGFATYSSRRSETVSWIMRLSARTEKLEYRQLLEVCCAMLRIVPKERPRATNLGDMLPAKLRCKANPNRNQGTWSSATSDSSISSGDDKVGFLIKQDDAGPLHWAVTHTYYPLSCGRTPPRLKTTSASSVEDMIALDPVRLEQDLRLVGGSVDCDYQDANNTPMHLKTDCSVDYEAPLPADGRTIIGIRVSYFALDCPATRPSHSDNLEFAINQFQHVLL